MRNSALYVEKKGIKIRLCIVLQRFFTFSHLMPKFKAVIVGGSIAGQTLALAFQKADIDYVLLEAQTEFAPQLGASVGLWPNGLRILDQLGLLEEIQAVAEPLREGFYRRPDGTAFGHSNLFAKMTEMYTYAFTIYVICFYSPYSHFQSRQAWL
jgi:hypothetical protein